MTVIPGIYETLTKQIVYGFDQPAAQTLVNGFLASTGYKIDQIFNDTNTGFQALGLVSITPDKAPVLVFRGIDSELDNLANSDPRGIGFNQFIANKQAISNWLTQIGQDRTKNPSGLLPDIIGHSLGGAIAQLTATEFTNLVGDIITFNSPGVTNSTVELFQQNGGANKTVIHYIVNGDNVSLGGQAFLPGKAFLISYTNPEIAPLLELQKHSQAGLFTNPPPGLTVQEISVDELNKSSFSYNNSDTKEFLAAVQVAVSPQLAISITSRAGVEALRTSAGFSYLGLILGVLAPALDPARDNYLLGDDNNNFSFGLDGNDTINGNGGNDSLYGNRGDDIISGGAGIDIIYGGQGNDFITGNQGDDFLLGDLGNDTIFGGQDNDFINGKQGDDLLLGDRGNDVIYGGQGNDRLFGNDGNDFLSGDIGNDTLIGGNGNDIFVLAANQGTDTIIEFQKGQDVIGLVGGLTFTQLTISQNADTTSIAITNTGEILASLLGVKATIQATDFISV